MRKIICIFAYFLALQAWANPNVLFNFDDFTSSAQTNRILSLYFLQAPQTNGSGLIITRDRIRVNCDTNGSVTVSNVFVGTGGGDYRGEFAGTSATTTNFFHFPLTNGLINAAQWITAPTNITGGFTAYTTAQSDSRYILNNAGTGSNITLNASTTIGGTNGIYGLLGSGNMTNAAGSRVAYLSDTTAGAIFTNSAGTIIPTTNAPVSLPTNLFAASITSTNGMTNATFNLSGVVTADTAGGFHDTPVLPSSMIGGPFIPQLNGQSTNQTILNQTNNGFIVGPGGLLSRPGYYLTLTNATVAGGTSTAEILHSTQTNKTGWWIASGSQATDGFLFLSLDQDGSDTIDPSNYLANATIKDSECIGSAPGYDGVFFGQPIYIQDSFVSGTAVAQDASNIVFSTIISGYAAYGNAANIQRSIALGYGTAGNPTLSVLDTFIGYSAGPSASSINSTGNVAIGSSAATGFGNTNLVIGHKAGASLGGGNNNIIIGNPGTSTDTNIVRIGNGQTISYLSGIVVGNGFSSTAVNTSMLTTSTGCTNSTGMVQIAYVTAATGASLTDNAGNTEFSSVTISAFTPIRIQNGGKFTGSGITYAAGSAAHAW